MLARWLETEKPDAVICSAPLIVQSMKELGRKIPEEIGMASMSRYDNPINAGIDQNPEEIGRTAVQSLVSQLNENSYGIPASPKEILVEGRWMDGPMLPGR
ncbi:substrate-binding domain-containing protein [Pontiella agarivorans]|uniref:Substrate-binding domain-containing protein n=1 Tax=Pontiella agarivorans TaxID=3038953 RepID=A0ABU5MX33_9BACT|nr:substrate-binding domain-containing protein [Pontiella agarivorans]MDZ8118759.1 substrate-binding domain-containing protein [Pontiella agarivorans]